MLLDKYISFVMKEKLHSSKGNLSFYLEYIFRGIDFSGKRVLDIGGGSGLLSTFCAVSKGASEVVCLEPEIGGTQLDATEKFMEARSTLGVSDKARLEKSTLQAYDAGNRKFDIIISHDSINHLDEEACVRLSQDESARKRYHALFRKLHDITSDSATLIIADCSRYNFFALCHMKNPFAPYIDWKKHQSPYLWASLLSDAGFRTLDIRWWSYNSLRSLGKWLLGNRLAAYFLYSHFCLTMKKKSPRSKARG